MNDESAIKTATAKESIITVAELLGQAVSVIEGLLYNPRDAAAGKAARDLLTAYETWLDAEPPAPLDESPACWYTTPSHDF